MTSAFIFDAVRTPRGKGKKDGSLHEVKPVDLLGGLLEKLRLRHGFDSAQSPDRDNLSISDPACKAGTGWFVGGGQSQVLSNLADGLFVVP